MIALLPFDLARIEAARRDPSRIDGYVVADGALPPPGIAGQAFDTLRAGGSPLWSAPRLFVDTDAGRIVGSGIFKSEPSDGWVEIDYGIAPACRGRGHATDAVFAMVLHAFTQPGLRAVYAETAVVNVASRRVVQKVGFRCVGRRLCDDDGPVDCWFVEAS